MKCNLYIYRSVHSAKSSVQHMCPSTLRHGVACTTPLAASTCKLLTGSSTQLWSMCELWATLLRCSPCTQPKNSIATRDTNHQRRSSGDSDFVHDPQVDQTSICSIRQRLETARCSLSETRETAALHLLCFTITLKSQAFFTSSS